ncbi:MAG: DUF975 family protein [Clostridia bacterium]
MSSSNYRYFAKSFLKNRWFEAILVTFVAMLLGGTYFSSHSSSVITSSSTLSEDFALITLAMSLVFYFVGAVVNLGYNRYLFALAYGNRGDVSLLFSQFNNLARAGTLRLLVDIYTTLWTMLFIIPGIVKMYSYSMSSYILTENPYMSANEAITVSKNIMQGHRFRLFCLDLSFIGWSILSLLTFGLGFIVLLPYIEASRFAFYLDLTGRTPMGTVV